jgi:tetratricopeptide (TPR) repeat protein
MSLVAASPASHQSEAIIREYVNREFGHFVVSSDDRVFINVLRRTIVTELGLPSNCMTVLTSHEQIVKTVKEMSVRKKSVLVFIQTSMNNVKLEDIIKQIAWRIPNGKVVIVTTEAELHHLALLREQKIADNWIVKPVVINQLLAKVASIIKPHGNLDKLIQGAKQYLEQGSFRHVLIICKKIFETNPDSAVACLYMGDAHRGLEQEEEMVRAYEQAGYLDEMFLEPACRLVDFYRAKGDKEKELRYLEKLDTLSPLNMDRKMEIAKLHLEMGHNDDASGTFDSVMKMTTKKMNDAVSQMALKIGAIYAANGNPEAEKYYRKAIETYGAALNKSHIHLFNNLGIYLRKSGKLMEAIAESVLSG